MTTREQWIKYAQATRKLAEQAKSDGLEDVAAVLYCLSGAIWGSSHESVHELAELCRGWVRNQLPKVEAARANQAK